MEYKAFDFEVKAVNEDEGTFSGYASVFGNVDLFNDIVMPGAFTKTLQERGDRVAICWQHDWKQPLGKPVLREDGKGLWVDGKISDTALGRDVLTLLRDGVITTMSIGYDTVKHEWGELNEKGADEDKAGKAKKGRRVRRLQEVRLYEISLVTVGANEQARLVSVKDSQGRKMELKGAIPYSKTPLAPRETDWDAAAERAKCDSVDDLRAICALVDGDPELEGSYKLPHHKGDAGHACVWNGVKAAGGALRGARGGVEGEGQGGARSHISKHYGDFDESPPWEAEQAEKEPAESSAAGETNPPVQKGHSKGNPLAVRQRMLKRLLACMMAEPSERFLEES